MFTKTAYYYDKIYSFKDYQAEVESLLPLIREHLQSGGNRLLDVACGTGKHIEYLKEHFGVEGLDISEELLEIARVRNPTTAFHLGDMIDFNLGCRFDVITCLFSSIGYVKTLDNLTRTIGCMVRHLAPGGLLLIEPWFTPDTWHPRTVHAQLIDEPNLKIARVNTSFAKGRLSYFDLHHLIATPEGTEHIVEHHELGLFTTEEIGDILENAGLSVAHDSDGLTGRGLFIGECQKGD
ncbi:MAG: class I SAM-dependent methyltransferase [Candidatus Bipolaricaulota bacterium]|nr:class I SAM-dependent methyltransferase [Candidatus Bipolaricaulota bacterium]